MNLFHRKSNATSVLSKAIWQFLSLQYISVPQSYQRQLFHVLGDIIIPVIC